MPASTTAPEAPAANRLDEDAIRAILRQVVDPEVGMNIVDLGLVYGIVAAPETVAITLTMTSPACPMGDMILEDIHAALESALPSHWERRVDLVWEPPWNPDMMNEHAREHFGWDGDTGQ